MSATSGDVYDLDMVVPEILNESGRLQRRTIVMSESAIVATTPTIHISYTYHITLQYISGFCFQCLCKGTSSS